MGDYMQPVDLGVRGVVRCARLFQTVKTEANMPKLIGWFLTAQIVGSAIAMIVCFDLFMFIWGVSSIYRAMRLLGK